jgi:hypothetical protein
MMRQENMARLRLVVKSAFLLKVASSEQALGLSVKTRTLGQVKPLGANTSTDYDYRFSRCFLPWLCLQKETDDPTQKASEVQAVQNYAEELKGSEESHKSQMFQPNTIVIPTDATVYKGLPAEVGISNLGALTSNRNDMTAANLTKIPGASPLRSYSPDNSSTAGSITSDGQSGGETDSEQVDEVDEEVSAILSPLPRPRAKPSPAYDGRNAKGGIFAETAEQARRMVSGLKLVEHEKRLEEEKAAKLLAAEQTMRQTEELYKTASFVKRKRTGTTSAEAKPTEKAVAVVDTVSRAEAAEVPFVEAHRDTHGESESSKTVQKRSDVNAAADTELVHAMVGRILSSAVASASAAESTKAVEQLQHFDEKRSSAVENLSSNTVPVGVDDGAVRVTRSNRMFKKPPPGEPPVTSSSKSDEHGAQEHAEADVASVEQKELTADEKLVRKQLLVDILGEIFDEDYDYVRRLLFQGATAQGRKFIEEEGLTIDDFKGLASVSQSSDKLPSAPPPEMDLGHRDEAKFEASPQLQRTISTLARRLSSSLPLRRRSTSAKEVSSSALNSTHPVPGSSVKRLFNRARSSFTSNRSKNNSGSE